MKWLSPTTAIVLTGWHPDPFGVHELRLFSPEGMPTQHVRNGDLNSYEKLPEIVRPTSGQPFPEGQRQEAPAN